VAAVPLEALGAEDDMMAVQEVAELRDGFPRGARWLTDPIDVRHSDIDCRATLAVERALRDVFLMEAPPGSNRGKSIDEYNTRAGSPLGSPYCASAVTAWWEDVGLEVPERDRASCDVLYRWALKTRRFHLVLSIEANTSMDGRFNREGFAFDRRIIERTDKRVLGFVRPAPVGA
jgi:hypothetical protein